MPLGGRFLKAVSVIVSYPASLDVVNDNGLNYWRGEISKQARNLMRTVSLTSLKWAVLARIVFGDN